MSKTTQFSKPSLSFFANNLYDQLWLKAGSPGSNELPEYLRDLIYGSSKSDNYDGIHLNGTGASRHFNYSAKQTIKPILAQLSQSLCPQGKRVQIKFPFKYADASKHQSN